MADHNRPTGRGWAFPPSLDAQGHIKLVDDEENIKQSIYVILNTAPGERVMRPEFGCRIHEAVFAPANIATAAAVERHVTEALGRWEPRIEVKEVRAVPQAADAGKLLIEIVYRIKDRQATRSLVYPFYVNPE